jgi:hypothetical protein
MKTVTITCRGGRTRPGRHRSPGSERRGDCRGAGRVEAAQVHVQLPVTKPVRGLVRPVQGKGGLADADGATDRGDRHRPRRTGVGLVQHPGHLQFGGPAGEAGYRRGQLPRHRRRREQLPEPVGRNSQRLSQLGPQSRQSLWPATFPPHHGGALHVQPLGQLFLGLAHRRAVTMDDRLGSDDARCPTQVADSARWPDVSVITIERTQIMRLCVCSVEPPAAGPCSGARDLRHPPLLFQVWGRSPASRAMQQIARPWAVLAGRRASQGPRPRRRGRTSGRRGDRFGGR